jgi:hypothetical protein
MDMVDDGEWNEGRRGRWLEAKLGTKIKRNGRKALPALKSDRSYPRTAKVLPEQHPDRGATNLRFELKRPRLIGPTIHRPSTPDYIQDLSHEQRLMK